MHEVQVTWSNRQPNRMSMLTQNSHYVTKKVSLPINWFWGNPVLPVQTQSTNTCVCAWSLRLFRKVEPAGEEAKTTPPIRSTTTTWSPSSSPCRHVIHTNYQPKLSNGHNTSKSKTLTTFTTKLIYHTCSSSSFSTLSNKRLT
jgi:hypothetical protein